MRYYDVALFSSSGATSSAAAPFRRWSSHPNGQYDPAAPQVEFDMPVTAYGAPTGAQAITIHGVPLQDLSQAYKLAGMEVVVTGGMKQGLPLANPSQAGLLLKGQVFQSYGNWQGTDMRLDLVVYPSQYTSDLPGNFVVNWLPGQSLASALKATLSTVYPNIPVSINIGQNLVFDTTEVHFCATLEDLAQYVSNLTASVFKQEVTITLQAGKFVIFDKTYQPSPIQIAFTDLIGQPTWIQPDVMQMKTVMRADLQIGSAITMPQGFQNAPGLITTLGSSLPSSIKYQSTFQNNFTVTDLRHLGNYRSPAGEDWATVFNCFAGDPNGQ